MKQGIQLLFAGSDAVNGDFSRLHRLAKGNKTHIWACPKKTRAGDKLLIYVSRPNSAIVASAEAMRDGAKGKYWRYETRIGNVRILKNAITLAEMRVMFPRWAWLRYPRAYTYLKSNVAERLWQRSRSCVTRGFAEQVNRGAGFGDPKTNPLVERAAVNRVRRHLRRAGFRVVSRERAKIGYDLEATKGRHILHVEVKGVNGSDLGFAITAGEVGRARTDRAFRLFVVTQARERDAQLHKFTGKSFLLKFALKPLSFMARMSPEI